MPAIALLATIRAIAFAACLEFDGPTARQAAGTLRDRTVTYPARSVMQSSQSVGFWLKPINCSQAWYWMAPGGNPAAP